MKGEIFMNPTEIEVRLLAVDSETDVLRFFFDEEKIDVNLNSSTCQNDIKNVFVRVLNILVEKEVLFNLVFDKDYDRTMYKEVCTEYINDLNKEIQSVRGKIVEELE